MRKFWIDTDTASDDAVAILMASRWPDVEVVGVSIVVGNMPVEIGCKNARYTLELCGKQTPVYLGAPKPLLREPSFAYFFHGPDGMGGMNYPEPKLGIQPKHAVEALIETVRAHPGEITLVTIGPLTNIALALAQAPDLVEKIPICYVMGGAAVTLGNITPAAEYNIWVDPEAARMVFHSGLHIVMTGWELCRGDANLSEEDMAYVHSLKTIYGNFAIECNRQAIETNRNWLKDPALPLPDPVTMSCALDPSVMLRKSWHYVDVETLSEVTRGMTVVDELGVLNKKANIEVCWQIDVPKWKETLYKTLRE